MFEIIELDPASFLAPYIYGEIGIAEHDKGMRGATGIGLSLIKSSVKLDLFYNLYSKMGRGERENEYGIRFTME